MEHFIDEKTVMRFYLDLMKKDEIVFLKGKDELKKDIKKALEKLINEEKMNSKIQIAVGLWKKLFEAAMSNISPNKQGYDKIFKYFDSYVEFEELIFASDSFYRDHTLHCLWVYFLGEYLHEKPEFSELYRSEREMIEGYEILRGLADQLPIINDGDADKLKDVLELLKSSEEKNGSVRCIAALTHDLGYPLKKIEKINKAMNKVLPYFAIHNFDNFKFEYENIQQQFVSQFIDFIARNSIVSVSNKGNLSKETQELLKKIFERADYTFAKEDAIAFSHSFDSITEEERALIKDTFNVNTHFHASFSKKAAYYNDFEAYQHGIMSAFLLMKNLQAFQDIDFCRPDTELPVANTRILELHEILASISDHTRDSFKISAIGSGSFLTFVDELEEFSRISRASQNREYVEEFCDTALYMEDGWLNVVFEFNNDKLDNLDPEISFKGRCKRFLSLFDIANLDKYLKIRVKIVGKLPTDENEYVLEIAHKHADIRINGESQIIPKYLKSTQYYTKEEYAQM
ncbi:MAG: hypothetical protein IKX87_00130 [Lachnospiraceae bacterium]|nr:hypothetical protein [Lachnospiraceae bacterium]